MNPEEDQDLPSKETLSEEEQQEEINHVKWSFKRILVSLRKLFVTTFNIREGAEVKQTTEGIKRDISFKGHNSWILVFSIFIASIGLNVNSIPVVIGAMLISPLMGPILGIGLAVGTNDWETLTRSLKNFGIMILIALATSVFYFAITPLTEITSELLNRVKPTLLDVFIAIFGGLAGIVAGSRKEKSNVVPGVAIATALMPPLCTAGYGLANGNTSMFFGAMYLFLLNSVFICLSTYFIIRYLRFPLKEFVDRGREKKIRVSISVFVALVIIPSGFIFYDVIRETIFNRNVRNYMAQEVFYEGAEIINEKILYDGKIKRIDLFLIGERVPDQVVNGWKKKLEMYDLNGTELQVHQAKDESGEIAGKLSEQVKSGIISDLYEKNQQVIASKDQRIAFLENELVKLQTKDSIPLQGIFKEAKVLFPWVSNIKAGFIRDAQGRSSQQSPLFFVQANSSDSLSIKEQSLTQWLEVRSGYNPVEIVVVGQ